ncbi:LuxR C-terminal-related transcriptional regulator [Pseudomonas sp. JS3066]|jgi:LuxR family maltose regulon positive regulatory protein|uniref:LuxR C-terminal-related transcriptional regulator n=1 Tax=unclassified Pseudomonas TaxID=196821 RepID=UPI00129D3E09|nr:MULTISPECIES: LuxR C-terminal-related transcriptional regulator [unclassified Pseudomonas]MDH4652441.1 helix-turn-helix transcriptional regulator [Pseudomonas sp. BN606]MRK20773.1 helix-turn-helix transcriptional regulator [Pseudomonas sp. JG-B]WVK92227.1 LuxR C-terminal-related transcriptional regulator [Pseudomonas sp. JS3066]
MTVLTSSRTISSSAVPVADARFFRPPRPAGHVPRPRLCERLAAGLDGRLLMLSAPAGFGKSSLAIEFCEDLPDGWQSLWLSLSRRDSDPGRFLERLLDGLRQFYPGLGDEAMGHLKMRQRHQPFAFEQWLDGLLDEVAERLDANQPLLLVLDDYHLAQNAVLDRCLQFLLNHLPDGWVLLVTSRQRPDWHLARLRLSRHLLELNEQDLRLTEDECLALLSSQGTKLDSDDLEGLLQRSEGWVAGLRLWLLAGQEAPAGTGVEQVAHGDESLIREYLLEEVIERQPPEVQAFLFETARFERFCAELCDAVRESHDSAAILRHLQAHQVFLVPLDEQGQWFRYHHLFSDLLRARGTTSLTPSGMHLRACRWFSARGLLDEAVEQALRAGQPDVAASLVQNLSEEQLLANQNIAMLLRWKMDLPDSLLSSTPRLIVLYSLALGLACQLDAAEELASNLARFLPAPDAAQQRSLLVQWQAINGLIARGRGDIERAEASCTEALTALSPENYGQRHLCLSLLGNIALVRGDLWRARGLNREALEMAQRGANPLFESLVHYDRARVLQVRGETLRAQAEVQKGLERLRGVEVPRACVARARLMLYQGFLLCMRMQHQAARVSLQAGIAEARACRDISLLIGHCALAALEGREGRFAAAFAQLAEAERLMHIWDVPPVYYLAMITLSKCELWLAQGQLELAEAWLPRLEETYAGEGAAAAPEFHPLLPLCIEQQSAALSRAQGKAVEAEARLRALLEKAESQGIMHVALGARLQLVSLLRTSREREASALLDRALECLQCGSLLPYRELLEQHPQWLREQLATRSPDSVRELLDLLPGAEVALPADVGAAEALSSRELAVLQLIAQGCSNQEISERLFISLHTVKSHARHINSKLGVERRTQAVARAKALGLLR